MITRQLGKTIFASTIIATAAVGYWQFFDHKDASDQNVQVSTKIKVEAPKATPSNTPTAKPSYSQGINSAFGKFQTGDYAAAILLLREYLIQNPNDEQAKKNLATCCFALGLQRIKEQRFAEAGNLLEEATNLGHPQAAAALARLRIRTGEVASATSVLEDIFWKNRDVNAAWALVDLALSRDDLQLADAYLNRAEGLIEKMGPEAEALRKALSEKRARYQLRAAFSQGEIVLERGNIQVAYLAPEKRPTAEAVLNAMNNVQEQLSQTLAPSPDNVRFRALVVPSADFGGSTGAPPWAQAIYDGIIRLSVGNGQPTSQEILRAAATSKHEMLHAHLSALCGDIVPSWLGEGLAQQTEGRPIAQSIAALRTKLGTKLPQEPPSDPWFDKEFYEAPTEHINELYARSHLLVETIQRSHGSQIWNTIFTKSCVNKEPLGAVLNSEVGKPTGIELWKLKFPEILLLFQNKK